MTRAEIEEKIDSLYEELDNLEGCEDDNEVYADRIREIRDEIGRLDYEEADPVEFKLLVTINGKATVTAETLNDAKLYLYNAVKNNPEIVVESIDIEEEY